MNTLRHLRMFIYLCVVCCISLTAGSASAVVVQLQASDLAAGVSWDPFYSVVANDGHLEFGAYDSGTRLYQTASLLRYDLSILDGLYTSVNSVTLQTTTKDQFAAGDSGDVGLSRVGDAYVGWTPGATWWTSDGGTEWAGGADMFSIGASPMLATETVTRGEAPGTVHSWTVSGAEAQTLIDDWTGGVNAGLSLHDTGAVSIDYRTNAYSTSGGGAAAERPLLIVDYEGTAPPVPEEETFYASKLASGVSWNPNYSVPGMEGGHLEFGAFDLDGTLLSAVTLLQFDVSAAPDLQKIQSVRLETTTDRQFSIGDSGAVELYRIDDVHTDWANEATWASSDGITPWSDGADMSSIQTGLALASLVVTRGDAPGTVYHWEITDAAVAQSLIADWLAGDNSGLALVDTGATGDADYRTNAGGFPVDLELQPRLIIRYFPWQDLLWDGTESDWAEIVEDISHWSGGDAPDSLPEADSRVFVSDGRATVTDVREALSASIEAPGAIEVAAGGELTLIGDGESLVVGPGALLQVDGSLTAAGVWVEGTLGGGGSLASNVFLSDDGVLSPGGSTGQLSIFGELEFSETAEYHVEIAGNQNDSVLMQGDFLIEGSAYPDGSLTVAGLSPITNESNATTWGDKVLTIMAVDETNEGIIEGEFGVAIGSTIPTSYGSVGVDALPNEGTYLGAGTWFGNAADATTGENGVYYSMTQVDIGVFQAAPGDGDGNRIVDISDIMAVLAAGKFGDGTYGDSSVKAAEGDAQLLITADGLVLDTAGATINGYVLSSESGVLTGEAADNLGLFTEDTDEVIGGQFAFTLNGRHLLGDVIGDTDVDLTDDLTLTYTLAGEPGVFTASVLVPEPGTIVMLLSAAMGLLLLCYRRRV